MFPKIGSSVHIPSRASEVLDVQVSVTANRKALSKLWRLFIRSHLGADRSASSRLGSPAVAMVAATAVMDGRAGGNGDDSKVDDENTSRLALAAAIKRGLTKVTPPASGEKQAVR